MAKKKKAPKRKTGAVRMKQLGYRLVTVWLTPDEYQAVRKKHPKDKLATLGRRLFCADAGI